MRDPSRRHLLGAAGAGATWLVTACNAHARSTARPEGPPEEEEVSPNEDLMREHGLLERILLVYEESVIRLDAGGEVSPAVLAGAADIVRHFVEDYHEQLEEDFVFPRLEQAHRLEPLVATLRAQHTAGRALTDQIARLATVRPDAGDSRRELAGALRAFIRMYRPHAAREDTVLFPAFRAVVSAHEYGALGEEFEDREHARFGADGFTGMVEAVATLERELGIDDLAIYTPR